MLKESITGNGMLLKKKVEYVEDPKVGSKAIKEDNKQKLVITDTIGEFQADTVSINYLSSIVALSNAKYNNEVHTAVAAATAAGTAVDMGAITTAAYTAVYVNTIIPWKLKNNTTVQVTVEKIMLILEESMTAVGTIVGAQ